MPVVVALPDSSVVGPDEEDVGLGRNPAAAHGPAGPEGPDQTVAKVLVLDWLDRGRQAAGLESLTVLSQNRGREQRPAKGSQQLSRNPLKLHHHLSLSSLGRRRDQPAARPRGQTTFQDPDRLRTSRRDVVSASLSCEAFQRLVPLSQRPRLFNVASKTGISPFHLSLIISQILTCFGQLRL